MLYVFFIVPLEGHIVTSLGAVLTFPPGLGRAHTCIATTNILIKKKIIFWNPKRKKNTLLGHWSTWFGHLILIYHQSNSVNRIACKRIMLVKLNLLAALAQNKPWHPTLFPPGSTCQDWPWGPCITPWPHVLGSSHILPCALNLAHGTMACGASDGPMRSPAGQMIQCQGPDLACGPGIEHPWTMP